MVAKPKISDADADADARGKRARLDLRLHDKLKMQIERAAEISGRSVSEFVAAAAEQVARTVLAEHDELSLTATAREVFFDALRKPAPPSPRLRNAADRYKALAAKRSSR